MTKNPEVYYVRFFPSGGYADVKSVHDELFIVRISPTHGKNTYTVSVPNMGMGYHKTAEEAVESAVSHVRTYDDGFDTRQNNLQSAVELWNLKHKGC